MNVDEKLDTYSNLKTKQTNIYQLGPDLALVVLVVAHELTNCGKETDF